ncbi:MULTISPECIES: hypothetical protein [unclassified Brevundimonas]|uniref:hypothetical protein n=1 Tax=unclassified Brevundimonas TaxID=2622653 RepID=UPI0025BE5766|nr:MULTISPECIES: hypothetical protein [unclassified Brevundimonas]
MSSPAANDLNRILLGSAIGAAIGLVLLALGVAILWNAADQKLREASPTPVPVPASASGADDASPAAVRREAAVEATASPTPYPVLGPAPPAPPATAPAEPPRRAATSIWRSIFDDEAETGQSAAPAAPAAPASAAPRAANPRPAPRPATPRRPPEAQRQDDSLFF